MSAARMITGLIGAFGGGAVGRMLGGRTGGMLGSLAGSMLSRNMGRGGAGGGIGSLLGGLMGGGDQDDAVAAVSELNDDDAMILIKAMCNAAKADGQIDADEINNIVNRANLDAEDQDIIRAELNTPLDLAAFIAEVPSHLGAEVYTASLLPIEVDTASEVTYLQELARGLGLDGAQVSEIHESLGLR